MIIHIGDLLKISTKKFLLREIKLPSYHNKTIGPRKVLKFYIDLTKNIRGDLAELFITTTKP